MNLGKHDLAILSVLRDNARSSLQEISAQVGSQFDPEVADAFLSLPADAWREVRERVHREVTALEEQVKKVIG